MKACAVGVDVGGTSARAGLVQPNGRLLFSTSWSTGINVRAGAFRRALRQAVEAALRQADRRRLRVTGIGVGMPGFVDKEGRVAGSCNLPALNGAPLRAWLEEEFRLPARLENDVSAAAYGEFRFGGHGNLRGPLLFVALGTGIGAGLIVDGQPARVTQGCLGDPGHIIVDPSGDSPCRCGGNGCLEAVASGWALVEQARGLGMEVSPAEIFRRARRGDRQLAQLARRAARFVGIGLASLCALFNPRLVVLGGGTALEGGEPLRRLASRTLRRHGVPFFCRHARVVLARTGPGAGLAGAAALALFGDRSGQATG